MKVFPCNFHIVCIDLYIHTDLYEKESVLQFYLRYHEIYVLKQLTFSVSLAVYEAFMCVNMFVFVFFEILLEQNLKKI